MLDTKYASMLLGLVGASFGLRAVCPQDFENTGAHIFKFKKHKTPFMKSKNAFMVHAPQTKNASASEIVKSNDPLNILVRKT